MLTNADKIKIFSVSLQILALIFTYLNKLKTIHLLIFIRMPNSYLFDKFMLPVALYWFWGNAYFTMWCGRFEQFLL
jgi:hypothetical protein